jgi:hypothetical protein
VVAQPFLGTDLYPSDCGFINAYSLTVIASLLAWMAWIVDDPLKARALWLVVIFPALVYLTFGFYGGKIIRKHLLMR